MTTKTTRDDTHKRAVTMLDSIKRDLRRIIDDLSDEASQLSKSDDPHTPIIETVQLALLTVSVEYLLTCGVKIQQAVDLTMQHSNHAQYQWLTALQAHKRAEATQKGEDQLP